MSSNLTCASGEVAPAAEVEAEEGRGENQRMFYFDFIDTLPPSMSVGTTPRYHSEPIFLPTITAGHCG